MNDHELKQLFQQNQPALPDDPGFQRDVWHKIAEGNNQGISFSDFLNVALDFLTRPMVGVPLAILCIAGSATLSFYNGIESREQTWVELSLSYNQLINPLTHNQ